MEFYPGEIYHIYNRGNIHQKIFFERKNYLFFLRKMERHIKPYCEILSWCLMPNHFHWLVKIKETDEFELNTLSGEGQVIALNNSVGVMLRSYTRAMNVAYKNKGSLFQQKTKSKNVNTGLTLRDNYALVCFLYIMQNPVKAGLVKNFHDWEFSSFLDFSGLRKGRLCNMAFTTELLDLPTDKKEFAKFACQTLPDDYQDFIF
jgi:putative transposase